MKTEQIILSPNHLEGDIMSLNDCPVIRHIRDQFPALRNIRFNNSLNNDTGYAVVADHCEPIAYVHGGYMEDVMNRRPVTLTWV